MSTAPEICSIDGCERPRRKRDWCNTHYQRWRGDREQRDWPDGFMRGGPWPWTDPLMMQDVRHKAYGNNTFE